MEDPLRPPFASLAVALTLGCGAPPTAPPDAGPRPVSDVPISDLGALDVAATDVVALPDVPVDVAVTPDDSGAPRPMNLDLTLAERVPSALTPVVLPDNEPVVAQWVSPEGDAVLATRGGALYGVDVYGAVREIERIPGDPRQPGDAPVGLITERDAQTPLLLTPSGGSLVLDGWAQRAQLPAILRGARAHTRWGAEALWATGGALYATDGPRWLQIDRSDRPVTDVVAMVSGPVSDAAREAWVLREGGVLETLRVTAQGDARTARWTEPLPGFSVGVVRAIAGMGDARYLSRRDDLLRVRASGLVERLRVPGELTGPVALAPAGPWLWAAWDNGLEGVNLGRIRPDGAVEIIARGVQPFARRMGAVTVRIAADGERGESAVVTLRAMESPGDGGAPAEASRTLRVVVLPRVALGGVAEGGAVTFARVGLRALPPRPDAVAGVDFALDGTRIETVTAAPFAWGGSGRLVRDLPTLEFGPHIATVTVRYVGAEPLRRERRFSYLSPLGRVPTFTADIEPVYQARCARCHSSGIARDLRGYDRLSAQAPSVVQALLSRRMPPDLAVDEPTVLLFTSWIAGGTPR
jgi:hypothetical protein